MNKLKDKEIKNMTDDVLSKKRNMKRKLVEIR